MKNLKVIKLDSTELWFDNNITLSSNHESDCCENHYLDFSDITMEDFNGLEFDLSNDNFFKKIEGYGIELIPIKGYSIKVPGYGFNNGYYSTNLTLILEKDRKLLKQYDIEECQTINS